MHRKIYKYHFNERGDPMTAPIGDVVLVDYEGDGTEAPTIWIEHTPGCANTQYFMIGTGHRFDPDPVKHVGSARCGRFVWHVYAERS